VAAAAAAIPDLSFAELRDRLRIDERRIPIEGTIETTFRCNLRCAHCYVNEPVGAREVRERELPLPRLKRLVDEIVDAGCLFVLITGGEVLARPDFPELYVYAIRKGLLVTVFTNGTLVTDRIADLFDEYRPENVEISLYGMTRETYERVTGVPGSYDKCIAGIERLVARDIPLTLKTMALAWNVHEVAAMEAYAHRLGLPFRFDSCLNPRVDCGANRNGELQLTAEQAVALDLQSPERLRELREFCERFARPEVPRGVEQVYTCGAGQSAFVVDPYGKLQMCQLSRRAAFDVREGSFAEGWNEYFPRLRARTWQTRSVCRTCSLMSLCGSCPGAAEMETGDIEAMVPQFCEITHMRAWAAMGEAGGHRRDARCCLGAGALASRPPAEVERAVAGHGCGSCGSGQPEPPRLIQIERRATAARPAAPDPAAAAAPEPAPAPLAG
jgi:radical SAM protein with 4Fe4S-binding SPASM domain